VLPFIWHRTPVTGRGLGHFPRPARFTYDLERIRVARSARHPIYDLYHLAVLILNYVSYVDEALIAAVGPQALKAAVVGVESVVGVAVRYSIGVHSLHPFLWAGSRGVSAPPGPFLYDAFILPHYIDFVYTI